MFQKLKYYALVILDYLGIYALGSQTTTFHLIKNPYKWQNDEPTRQRFFFVKNQTKTHHFKYFHFLNSKLVKRTLWRQNYFIKVELFFLNFLLKSLLIQYTDCRTFIVFIKKTLTWKLLVSVSLQRFNNLYKFSYYAFYC